MRKILPVLLIGVMVFSLAACGGGDSGDPEEQGYEPDAGYEIAMITDVGTIDDKSFNQGTWEGVQAFAVANGIGYKYYMPTEQSTDAYLASIQLAIEGGAKIIVTPGFLFQNPIYIAQELYPDIHFVLIDGVPTNEDWETRIDPNTVGILFAEEQSGYLAGYAAVIEGYTKLGFMGGMAVPAVVRFGYGFAEGAEAAAAELGIASVELKYTYTNSFDATPEAQTLATSWYADGTEVIFACGGAMGNSVMAAAEAQGAKVVGVDVDQSGESETVITSAMKDLAEAVIQALAQFYDGTFPGGQSIILGADKHGVALPMATSKFETFTDETYDAVYESLADGAVALKTDQDAADPKALGLSIVNVTLIE